jgi:hypothetical protein
MDRSYARLRGKPTCRKKKLISEEVKTSGIDPLILRNEAALECWVAQLPSAKPGNVDLRIYAIWRSVLQHAHDLGDSQLLIKLLRSEIEMPQVARHMLAELLERRDLKKKRGGQRTPLFEMSAKGRFALAARDVPRVQSGECVLPSDWWGYLPLELRRRAKRGEAIDINELMRSVQRAQASKPPKPMTRQQAIDKVAELHEIDAQSLADYMDGKIGFSRSGRPNSG